MPGVKFSGNTVRSNTSNPVITWDELWSRHFHTFSSEATTFPSVQPASGTALHSCGIKAANQLGVSFYSSTWGLSIFWGGLSGVFHWGDTPVWTPCHEVEIIAATMGDLLERSTICTQDLWSWASLTFGFLVTSVIKTLIPTLISLVWLPGLGRVLAFPRL